MKLFVSCSCGFKDECDSDIELYKHAEVTVCLHNLWKNSPNWFRQDFDIHQITFKSLKQKIMEEREELKK